MLRIVRTKTLRAIKHERDMFKAALKDMEAAASDAETRANVLQARLDICERSSKRRLVQGLRLREALYRITRLPPRSRRAHQIASEALGSQGEGA